MNLIKVITKVFLCGLLLNISINSFATPRFQKSGLIELSNYTRAGYLANTLSSTFKLVSGLDIITIYFMDTASNAYKYELKLEPGRSNILRFLTFYKDESGTYEGHCAIRFEGITANKANFTILEDSTLYGCGIDANGYIGINFM